ncbi:MAG: hypothetical protein WD042_05360, partial [Phycisphaeraceae bacterium]
IADHMQQYGRVELRNGRPVEPATVLAEAQARWAQEQRGGTTAAAPAASAAAASPNLAMMRQRIAELRKPISTFSPFDATREEMAAALRSDGRSREAENPLLWSTAVHESAHAMVALRFNPDALLYATVNGPADGLAMLRSGLLTPDEDAAVSLAGGLAERSYCSQQRSSAFSASDRQGTSRTGANNIHADEASRGWTLAENAIDVCEMAIEHGARLLFDRVGRRCTASDLKVIWTIFGVHGSVKSAAAALAEEARDYD